MQTSDNMSTPHDVDFDDTLAATRGRSNYYFSFATWPIGVGTPCYSPSRVQERRGRNKGSTRRRLSLLASHEQEVFLQL